MKEAERNQAYIAELYLPSINTGHHTPRQASLALVSTP